LEQFAIFILSFITAILLITFITDSISSRVLRRVGPGVFASLVGVVVGFAITSASDIWKTSRDRQTELLRATKSVEQEIDTNIYIITADLSLIAKDDAAADKKQEIVTPLSPLVTSASETAYLRGSFDIYSSGLSVDIGKMDALAYIVNKRIDGREFFRFTSRPLGDYDSLRKIINTNVEALLRDQQANLNTVQLELTKLMPVGQ
jgi:hypothetical protein